jgi:hypothetical protein
MSILLRILLFPHRRKVLHQHAVDIDVTTADAAEEDAVGAKIEEINEISW